MGEEKTAGSAEERILNSLMSPKDSIDIPLIPIRLISESYNPKKISELTIQHGFQNELGYLADLALEIAEKKGFKEKITDLKLVVNTLYSHLQEGLRTLYKNLPFGYVEKKKEKMDDRMKKWGIITSIDYDELSDYIEDYLIKEAA